jgi:ABC-2 type transport system ATP-binding protein
VQDVTEVHAEGLSDEAKREIAEVIKRHGGTLKSMDNPTATMEDLFLNIVRQSEARPGVRLISDSDKARDQGDAGQ